MKRLTVVGVVVALLGAWSVSSVAADNPKTPTIKDVMKKLHAGANSPLRQVGKELKAAQPDWSKLQKQTKDFVILGAALAKNEPPRGSKQSWERLALSYYSNAKALDDAVQKESQPQATTAVTKLSRSCAACHRAHKGR